MTSGSMLIPNSLGKNTLLKIIESKASSDSDNASSALQDARARLKQEKASPSPNLGNINFLINWITLAIITSPEKTSVRLVGEPWEKDSYLKNKGENIATA